EPVPVCVWIHMLRRLESEHDSLVAQQCVQRPEALEVEIGIHATEGEHPHIAGSVDTLDRLWPRVVDGEKPLGMLRYQATRRGVGPEAVFPVGIVAQPAPLPISERAGDVGILPGLVEYAGDPHTLNSPGAGRFGLSA